MLSGFGFIWMTGFFPFARLVNEKLFDHTLTYLYTLFGQILELCAH